MVVDDVDPNQLVDPLPFQVGMALVPAPERDPVCADWTLNKCNYPI